MRHLLYIFLFFFPSLLLAQGYTIESQPVCWSYLSVDSSLVQYSLASTTATDTKILFYLNASGATVDISAGGTITFGLCDCGSSGGGSVVAINGLSNVSSDTIQLGGTQTANITIDGDGFALSITGQDSIELVATARLRLNSVFFPRNDGFDGQALVYDAAGDSLKWVTISGENIYNADGAQTDQIRTDTLGGKTLVFDGRTGTGDTSTMVRLQADFSSDDAKTTFLSMETGAAGTPTDSLIFYDYDTSFKIESSSNLNIIADNFLQLDTDSMFLSINGNYGNGPGTYFIDQRVAPRGIEYQSLDYIPTLSDSSLVPKFYVDSLISASGIGSFSINRLPVALTSSSLGNSYLLQNATSITVDAEKDFKADTLSFEIGLKYKDPDTLKQWGLFQRTIPVIPVPYLKPTRGNNSVIAFDLMPRGTPGDFGSEGIAWMDICDSDIEALGDIGAYLRLGITSTAVTIGSKKLSGALKPLNFNIQNTTRFAIDTTGRFTWSFYNARDDSGIQPGRYAFYSTGTGVVYQTHLGNFLLTDPATSLEASLQSILNSQYTTFSTNRVSGIGSANKVAYWNGTSTLTFIDVEYSAAQQTLTFRNNVVLRAAEGATAPYYTGVDGFHAYGGFSSSGTNPSGTAFASFLNDVSTLTSKINQNGDIMTVGNVGVNISNAASTPSIPLTVQGLSTGLGANQQWLNSSSTVTATMADAGFLALGTTSAPTAKLTLGAGTTTASTAPLKFTSGTNLTTPEAGAVEFDGTDLFYTTSTPTRRTVANLAGTQTFTNKTIGDKVRVTTGANTSIGTATLSGGTITVNTTAVNTASIIFVTCNTPGGTQGFLSVPSASIVNGTSFVINSSSGTDTSTVNWWIVN